MALRQIVNADSAIYEGLNDGQRGRCGTQIEQVQGDIKQTQTGKVLEGSQVREPVLFEIEQTEVGQAGEGRDVGDPVVVEA